MHKDTAHPVASKPHSARSLRFPCNGPGMAPDSNATLPFVVLLSFMQLLAGLADDTVRCFIQGASR